MFCQLNSSTMLNNAIIIDFTTIPCSLVYIPVKNEMAFYTDYESTSE